MAEPLSDSLNICLFGSSKRQKSGNTKLNLTDYITTKRLNEQVKRNLERYSERFMFRLTAEEVESLRSQFATLNPDRGAQRYLPSTFTEPGAVWLASVLNNRRQFKK